MKRKFNFYINKKGKVIGYYMHSDYDTPQERIKNDKFKKTRKWKHQENL